jgi:hypothetical protein
LTLSFTGQHFSASSLFPQFVPIRVIRVASFSMSVFQLCFVISEFQFFSFSVFDFATSPGSFSAFDL